MNFYETRNVVGGIFIVVGFLLALVSAFVLFGLW